MQQKYQFITLTKKLKLIPKQFLVSPGKSIILALSIASMMMLGISFIVLNRSQSDTDRTTTVNNSQPTIPTINALGKIEPRGGVIQVSAPSSFGQGSLVSEILVVEGQKIKAGELIAILEERNELQANLAEAKQEVEVAKSRLAQVQAGAQQGEITAREAAIERFIAQLQGEMATQQAVINRLEAELQGQKLILQTTVARNKAQQSNAETEVQRYETLFQQGAISSQEVENKRLTAETSNQEFLESQANQKRTIATLQQQINEAKANRAKTIATLQQQINEAKGELAQTVEVRPTDLANAQAEVDSAVATLKRIQTELDSAYIRAPQAGQILNINTKPGETEGNEGIVEIGQTDRMYVVAEIYESDIGKIRSGQTAIITSLNQTFEAELLGTVESIGLQIAKKDILDSDPTSATDARVIEVKIRLEPAASQKVANLTNLQVNIEINTK